MKEIKEDEIEIRRIENGWVLTYWTELSGSEGEIYRREIGFTCEDDDFHDNGEELRKEFKDMLWWLVEYFLPNSKHNKSRINIELERQHD